MLKRRTIAVDFDGTVVKHDYPKMGPDVPLAATVLRKLVEKGHRIILWTMRDGKELQDAVNWYKAKDIPLFGVNTNPEQKTWTSSPKAYSQLVIDDIGLGIPLNYEDVNNGLDDGRPFVDWIGVERLLVKAGYL